MYRICYFFEKERRQVIDEKERELRLMFHSITAILIFAGLFLVGLLGTRWFYLGAIFILIVLSIGQKNINRIRSKSNNNKIRKIRDDAYDEVLEKCKEASKQGEVTYFSTEDIATLVEELKNRK